MRLGNGFFLLAVFLVVALLLFLVMQVSTIDKAPVPAYNSVVSDWPKEYWRGGAGWSYPRYRDQPFYPLANSPHPRPYPPHAPMGGHAIHHDGHGH